MKLNDPQKIVAAMIIQVVIPLSGWLIWKTDEWKVLLAGSGFVTALGLLFVGEIVLDRIT